MLDLFSILRLGDSSLAEYELFQLLERYSLSLTELVFPVPQGNVDFVLLLICLVSDTIAVM